MKGLSLTQRVLVASSLAAVFFSAVIFFVLHQALTNITSREMDSLLQDESVSLSALVSSRPGPKLDFEVTPAFLSKLKGERATRFFRFLSVAGTALRESPGSPPFGCEPGNGRTLKNPTDGANYRVRSFRFQPEVDDDLKNPPPFERPWVCLVMGVSEEPYRRFADQTIESMIPASAAALVLVLAFLVLLFRRLTLDLSRLTRALEGASFGVGRAFPVLPKVRTPEVKAVIDRLEKLHRVAADAYNETWLFLGRAAHQLKTPVSAVQATLDVLLRKERSADELRGGLSDLRIGVRRMGELTQKLISSSRLSHQSAMELAEIDLETFMREELRLFQAMAESRSIMLRLEPGASVRLCGNEGVLSELFGMLLENAILYSNPGGEVKVSWQLEGGRVVISISDQGPGLPPQIVQRLFEPFVRGDERAVAGSGLGLSIAHTAAQLSGGTLRLASSSPKGSTFVVSLPLAIKMNAE